MKPDLGGRIALLRKKRNMTQEQLAKALGVSTPAVSKWETNHSCPDIAILCPLARALGTSVDALLLFEEEPDRDAVEKKAKEIVEAGREEGCEKGEALLKAWLYQYPSSASVQYNAAGILALFGMMFPEKNQEKKEAWLRQRRELLEKIRSGRDETYRGRALHDLAHLEFQAGNHTEAERILEETSQENVDMTMLRVQLYLVKGQREEALKILQKRLFTVLAQAHNYLILMTGEKITPEPEKALEIGKVCCAFEELFGVSFGMGIGIFMELYFRLGKKDEALNALRDYADAVIREAPQPNPLLFFPGVSVQEGKMATTEEMRRMLLEGLRREKAFDGLRGDERYREAVRKLEESL